MVDNTRYSAYPDISDGLPEGVDLNGLPAFPHASYEVTVAWERIESTIKFFEAYGLNLDPDYQREHVWTPAQQTAYLEYVLMGGELSKVIVFAADNWSRGTTTHMSLADGKQRLEAVRAFLRGEVYAFRRTFQELGGKLRMTRHNFQWRVVEVGSRADLLKLYLALNAGGTPHQPEELQRVQSMLAAELQNPTPFTVPSPPKTPEPEPSREPEPPSLCEASTPRMTAGRLDALEVLRGSHLRGERSDYMHSYTTQMKYLVGFRLVRRVPSNGGGPKWKWTLTDAGLALIDKMRPRKPTA